MIKIYTTNPFEIRGNTTIVLAQSIKRRFDEVTSENLLAKAKELGVEIINATDGILLDSYPLGVIPVMDSSLADQQRRLKL